MLAGGLRWNGHAKVWSLPHGIRDLFLEFLNILMQVPTHSILLAGPSIPAQTARLP